MQVDVLGNLWMICNGHIHKYQPENKIYACYDLPGSIKHGGFKGFMYKDNENNFYAGAKNHYITFRPEKIKEINHQPKVYLTDFKIFNESFSDLLGQKAIRLRHGQNYFSIEYAAPDFTGDNIQYEYKLEGVDKQWISAGKRNFAVYSNLAGGTYQFKVRASNWKDAHFDKITTITIVISPPYWLQWWFYVLIMLGVTFLLFVIYRYRINEFVKRQAIRNGIAQDLHDHIGSTLSSISIYSDVAQVYQDQHKSEELRKILKIIGDTSSEMISEMEDIVWAINPQNDHLQSIFQRIVAYAKPLCEAKNINFTLRQTQDSVHIDLGMSERKNLFLTLKEALNNAIKYANCKNLTLSVFYTGQSLELAIEDDGIGFDQTLAFSTADHSLGNGLRNIRSRAIALNATLAIRSEHQHGSSISLVFDVKNNCILGK